MQQDLLHLPGRHVLAAPADRILHPVDEAVVAVGVAHDAVAGVKPEIPPGFDRLVGHPEIARRKRERLGRAKQQLSGLTVRENRVIRIDNARLRAFDKMAHRPGTIGRDGAREHKIRLG